MTGADVRARQPASRGYHQRERMKFASATSIEWRTTE